VVTGGGPSPFGVLFEGKGIENYSGLVGLVAANRGLRTSLEVEELYATARHRIAPSRYRLLYCYFDFKSTIIPPLIVDMKLLDEKRAEGLRKQRFSMT
jgi:hypothetical protein